MVGEWIVEREAVVHFGISKTDTLVVILETTLLRDGEFAPITEARPPPSAP